MAASGGTHTNLSAAISTANLSGGAYQIIGVAAGTYTGAVNFDSVSFTTSKPKFLIIGLDGAAKTIFDGGGTSNGWTIQNSVVIESLTIRNSGYGFYLMAPSMDVRLSDLLLKDLVGTSSATSAIHVVTGYPVNLKVAGSTFLNNGATHADLQIWLGSGTLTFSNSVVWGQTSGAALSSNSGTTVTGTNSLVKGVTLSGTGNLAGTVDPKLRSDGHILSDSPLRSAGGATTQSRIDMDAELRPATSPDIGADQFLDSDADGLADSWETATAGNLTTLTGGTQDEDGDGLTNDQEYSALTNPTVADTDGDGVSDGTEVADGSNPLVTDTDGDGMPDGWEISHGLSATTSNAFDDADGDRYPNIFEYARSSDPSDRASIPTPNYTVAASGGTHTNVSAAVNAATPSGGAYQIIGIAPGTYTGAANLDNVTITTAQPKLLIIGLQGAAKTILDGGGVYTGWTIDNSVIVASLTIRNAINGFYFAAPASDVRFVDLLVKDALGSSSRTSAIHTVTGNTVNLKIINSTFLNNGATHADLQIWLGTGSLIFQNSVVWGTTAGTALSSGSGTTITGTNSLVKGLTLSGTGNLGASVDPKIILDGHIASDSPLRSAGGTITQSRIDIDNELRPATSPDIGVDQFIDSDSDGLADAWEMGAAGNLTTLTSATQDEDGDGLTNNQEYADLTNPTVADTDGDGAADGAEVTAGSNPLVTDTDGDDMPDGWELSHGLSATTANGFDDADGDRYPNVFEYSASSDPSDRGSKPTPNYVVNGVGGSGTFATLSDAINTASTGTTGYRIVGISAGTYTGSANLDSVSIPVPGAKLLVIGVDGPDKTIFDGGGTSLGWIISKSVVVSGITFRHFTRAIYLQAAASDVRFVDVLMKDGHGSTYATGIHSVSGYAVNLTVSGSTFVNNAGPSFAQDIWIGSGTLTLKNTVVTGPVVAGVLLVGTGSGITLAGNNSAVHGQTVTGSGNLAASVDPRVRSDGHIRSDSPLRGAGGAPQSRLDVEGDLRPTSAPDIGVDQFFDADSDEIADFWEVAETGNTTTLDQTGDPDADYLDNEGEYNWETDPFNPDTDHDAAEDGIEVEFGTNPVVADFDNVSGDANHDGIMDSIDVQIGYQPNNVDNDGDGVSNAIELLMCTNPFRADSDGDGVADNVDAFPLDPLVSSLTPVVGDVTPPAITLAAPWNAVEQ